MIIISFVAELKNQLSKFLALVIQWEEIEVRKHNIPIARVVPINPKRKNRTVPIDLEIMEEAYSLPDHFHQDPVDRIIVAKERIFSCSIVTADNKLLEYPHVQTLW